MLVIDVFELWKLSFLRKWLLREESPYINFMNHYVIRIKMLVLNGNDGIEDGLESF
jgi:hypothetical protein